MEERRGGGVERKVVRRKIREKEQERIIQNKGVRLSQLKWLERERVEINKQ